MPILKMATVDYSATVLWMRRPALSRCFGRRHDREAQKSFRESITAAAASLRVGNGLDEGRANGPVISRKANHESNWLIGVGEKEGARFSSMAGMPGSRNTSQETL